MNMKRLIATVALGLCSVGGAQAAQTWAFSYFGAGVTASGTFTTAGQASTFEPVLSISGTRNGSPISGLVALDFPDPDFYFDNLFSAVGDHFTDGGLLLDFGAALPHVNLCFFDGDYYDITPDDAAFVAFSVTAVTAVPEPATAASMLAGMALLAAFARRKHGRA